MSGRFGMCDIENWESQVPSGLLVDSIALLRNEAIDTCWNSSYYCRLLVFHALIAHMGQNMHQEKKNSLW